MRFFLLLVILILCAACLTLSARTAAACSCMWPSPQEAFDRYDVVVAGTVLTVTEIETVDGPMNSVHLQLKTVWKGEIKERESVVTNMSGAACGVSFSVGREYLVYARYEPHLERLATHLCTRTSPLEYAEPDLEFLGPGTAVTPVLPLTWGTIKARAL